jgi:hypothetical protein
MPISISLAACSSGRRVGWAVSRFGSLELSEVLRRGFMFYACVLRAQKWLISHILRCEVLSLLASPAQRAAVPREPKLHHLEILDLATNTGSTMAWL